MPPDYADVYVVGSDADETDVDNIYRRAAIGAGMDFRDTCMMLVGFAAIAIVLGFALLYAWWPPLAPAETRGTVL